jgi:damage-control phosphatase, subfamily I
MKQDCIQCINQQANKLLNRCNLNAYTRSTILKNLDDFLNKARNNGLTPPEAMQYLNQLMIESLGISDLYASEKKYYNQLLLDKYENLKAAISGNNASHNALKFALAANVIDFGQPDTDFDIIKSLSEAPELKPAIDHSEDLLKAVSEAETVLYLGDNAGEIVLDKLFIETLEHPNIYYAVRGSHVLNDATVEDATAVGMHNAAKVITNGHDAPSTILGKCSETFIKIYNEADIIIAKGQGNLEGLINEDSKKIFFLLLVKCRVIATLLGVPKGSTIVWFNQIRRSNSSII